MAATVPVTIVGVTTVGVAAAGSSLWLALTGGTTIMGGGVLGNGAASRSKLFARMMRLERLAGASGPGGTGTGATDVGGRTTGMTEEATGKAGTTGGGTTGLGSETEGTTGGTGGVETTTG